MRIGGHENGNEIRSVTDGVVKEVFVEAGMKVGLNDRIMVIE